MGRTGGTGTPGRPPDPAGSRTAGALGRAGEDAAARFLRRDGWTLLDRNARVRSGEIDLVLEKGGVMGFAEVKARRSRRAGTPEEAVDGRKADRMIRAAQEYLSRHGIPEAPRRLLIVAVDMDADGTPRDVRVRPLDG